MWRVLAAMVGEPDMPLRPLAGDPGSGDPSLDRRPLWPHHPREPGDQGARRPRCGAARRRCRGRSRSVSATSPSRRPVVQLRHLARAGRLGGHFELSFLCRSSTRPGSGGGRARGDGTGEGGGAPRRAGRCARGWPRSSWAMPARGPGRAVPRLRHPKAAARTSCTWRGSGRMTAAYPQVLIAQRTLGQVRAELPGCPGRRLASPRSCSRVPAGGRPGGPRGRCRGGMDEAMDASPAANGDGSGWSIGEGTERCRQGGAGPGARGIPAWADGWGAGGGGGRRGRPAARAIAVQTPHLRGCPTARTAA